MNDERVIKQLTNLKTLRKSKKITQLKLSMDLGVSQELISRYEKGSSFPQPQMLITLANYFNCSVDYLLGLTDVTTPTKYLVAKNISVDEAEILNKYNLLSSEDKKCFEKFLTFLLTNKNEESN